MPTDRDQSCHSKDVLMLVEACYPPLNGKKSCALSSSSRRAAPEISATARELRVRTLNVVDYRYFNSQAVPFSVRNYINEYVNTTTAGDHSFDSNRDLAAFQGWANAACPQSLQASPGMSGGKASPDHGGYRSRADRQLFVKAVVHPSSRSRGH